MRMADSDILIDVLRGHPPALAWLATLSDPPSVSGYVALELYAGCANKHQAAQVGKLLRRFPTVWTTDADAQQVLQQFPTLFLRYNLGVLDALIAACALGNNATLCTFNVKHFRALPNLALEQPYNR